MYKVIFIKEYAMTRDIKLENSNTGTIDYCFDDSSVVNNNGFGFMKIGVEYECKIKLFGNVVKEIQDTSTVFCEILCRDVIIGKKSMIKVQVENDVYYIPQKKLENTINLKSFYFQFTRKDLIQVNNVIHADLL